MIPKIESKLLYVDVQNYAKENNIRSMRQWFAFHNWRKGGVARPRNIPGDPSKYFGRRGLWTGWPDLLGTQTKATQVLKDEFMSVEDCKIWMADNKICTVVQFRDLSKKGERPVDVPSAPDKKYNVVFSDLLCKKTPRYVDFESAKEQVQPFKFVNYMKFREGRRDNKDELGCIPCNPDKYYSKWTSWPDFLGYSRLR